MSVSVMKKISAIVLFAALTVISSACGPDWRKPETISLEEAIYVLDQSFESVRQRNLDALCELGGSVLSCERRWHNSGEWDSAPSSYPNLISSMILPDIEMSNGTTSRGGRLLVLEGIDGYGDQYRSEILIFDEGGDNLVALNPVFWINTRIARSNDDGSSIAKPLSTAVN